MVAPVMEIESEREDPDLYRREAMGAFAHEVRTPLTSIKMVMELARRQASEGELVLDAELAEMLNSSVEDLQQLADDLQETSRLERGKVALAVGPADLAAAIDASRELMHGIELRGIPEPGIEGPWDAARLVRAIAGFATSANRIGDGSGTVKLEAHRREGAAELVFISGTPGRPAKDIAADAGFAFFRSRQLVLAMGGSVHCQRAERFAMFRIVLPLTRGDVR
jgi:signal transduction histidine kinase